MTLVLAAIANQGKSVVMAADRLWTRSMGSDFTEYGFEANLPKIKCFGKYAVGFSGNASYADSAFAMFSNELDLDSVVSIISSFIISEREKIIERLVNQVTGLSAREFFHLNQDSVVPKEQINIVYSHITELDISFNGLVTGFDKDNKARLVVIASNGEVMDSTFTGHYAIGEGGDFSIIFYDQERYNPMQISEADAVYFAFRAKKWSEAPTSVGDKTDIIIIREDGTSETIGEENHLMEILRDLLLDERKKTLHGRAERVSRLKELSEGSIH